MSEPTIPPPSDRIPNTVAYWRDASRQHHQEGRMAGALIAMENAFNHVQNWAYAEQSRANVAESRVAGLESQLTAIRDLLTPLLGTEACPDCSGDSWRNGDGDGRCRTCDDTKQRNIADGLSVVECVRRVVADRAAVAEMRERAAAKIEQQSALLSSMFDDRHEPLCRDLAAAIRALTTEEK